MLTCNLCQKKFKHLAAHLWRAHQWTAEDYRKRWPGAKMVSPKIQKEMLSRLNNPSVRQKQRNSASRELKRRWREDEAYRNKMISDSRSRWRDPEFKKQRSEQASQTMLIRWQNPIYRKKILAYLQSQEHRSSTSEKLRKLWEDPKYREAFIEGSRNNMLSLWEDPEFRRLMDPKVSTWTKPEKKVRSWLRSLGSYRNNKRVGVSFLPHRWLPTKGAGFRFNGDFVDYAYRCVIHVDGWHHRNKPVVAARDKKHDSWCEENDWLFLRLTDEEILKHPCRAKRKVQRFIREVESYQ